MKIAFEPIKLERSDNFEESFFGIEDEAVVIDILRSKLYSNPIKVLIQEYMSNARDAHREIDNDDTPIDVIAPTTISPTFEVRDYGPGLTPERISKVFVKYGSSTKRKSNKETGGFGIGAKSGWSYSDTFQVVSITKEKDQHIKRSYCCVIDDTRRGKLVKFSDDEITNEAVGTRVIVPVKKEDVGYFQTYIKQACVFWDVKPKLLNSTHIEPAIKEKGENWVYVDKYTLPSEFAHNKVFAIYDGIMYPIKLEAIKDSISPSTFRVLSSSCFGIKFGVGEVLCSANREELQYTEATKKTLVARIEELISNCIVQFEHTISKQTNLLGAIKAYNKICKDNGSIGDLMEGQLKWNNVPLMKMDNITSLTKTSKQFYVRIECFFDDKGVFKRVRDSFVPINEIEMEGDNCTNVYVNDLNLRAAPLKTMQYMYYALPADKRSSFCKYVISFMTNNHRGLDAPTITAANTLIAKWKKDNLIDHLSFMKMTQIPKPGKNVVIPAAVLKAAAQKVIKYKIITIPDKSSIRMDDTEDIEENISGYYAMAYDGRFKLGDVHIHYRDNWEFRRHSTKIIHAMQHLGIKEILVFTSKYEEYVKGNDELIPIEADIFTDIVKKLDSNKISNYITNMEAERRSFHNDAIIKLFLDNPEYIKSLNEKTVLRRAIEVVKKYNNFKQTSDYTDLMGYFCEYGTSIYNIFGHNKVKDDEDENDLIRNKYKLFDCINTYCVDRDERKDHVMKHLVNYVNSIDNT
jgi:hypothetical protein